MRVSPSLLRCIWAGRRHIARTMNVKKLLHTRMRVDDLERTVIFYEQALGLSVVRRFTSPRGAKLVFYHRLP